MAALSENAITKLASATVDVNTSTPTPLYTVPAGHGCIITHIAPRNPSRAVSTAVCSFGTNSPDFNNVVSNIQLFFTDTAQYNLIAMTIDRDPAHIGSPGEVLNALCSVLEGTPTTVVIDVFGYLLKLP